MSILQFANMTILECVLYSLAAIGFCLAFCGIGCLIFPKRGVIFQAVTGMTLVGSLGVLCAEFFAGLAKYVIISFFAFGLIILIVRFVRKKLSLVDIFKSIVPVIVLFTILLIHFLKSIVPQNSILDFNCHMTYFSGVPIELVRADYFSRLRIMDVYPFEWSKYHFFNGAFISIPLICFLEKNYITYILAKMITICFCFGALFDISIQKTSYKKTILYVSLAIGSFFLCAENGLVWSIETNNYSCIFMMLITWLMLEEKSYSESLVFSIGYALTKSGSIMSGGILFLYALFKLFKNDNVKFWRFIKKRWKEGVCCFTIGLAVLSTVFIGENASGQSSIVFGNVVDVLNNLFSSGWFSISPMGGALSGSAVYKLGFEYLYIAAVAFLVLKNRDNLLHNISKHKKIFRTSATIMVLVTVLHGFANDCIVLELNGLLIWYLVPLVSLLAICEESMLEAYLFYSLSLLLNFCLFNSSVTVPNFIIVNYIILMVFSRQLVDCLMSLNGIYKKILVGIICVGLIYFALYFRQTLFFFSAEDTYHEAINFEDITCTNSIFEYNSSDDSKLAKLYAVNGNRIHYNVLPTLSDPVMENTSMSMRFLPKGYEKYFDNNFSNYIDFESDQK